MRHIIFDIETQNSFQDTGKRDPRLLDISLLAIYDSETDDYQTFLEDELDELWPILEQADAIVGYNSDHFDIPLLNSYYHGDLEQMKSIDLMKAIEVSLGWRIGLDDVAKETLGIQKRGHGLQAVTWWRNGEIDKIRRYCIQDVKVTKKLFEHMKEHQYIKYQDRFSGEVKKVTVNTDAWDEPAGGVTQSLGF